MGSEILSRPALLAVALLTLARREVALRNFSVTIPPILPITAAMNLFAALFYAWFTRYPQSWAGAGVRLV